MEKPENKYQRGKIYKIVSNQTEFVYYGSTVEPYLTNRLSQHRQGLKRWLCGKNNYMSSFEIIKFNDCNIILVERYPCSSRDELRAREQYFIDNNNCINKYNAYTTLNTKRAYKRDYCKKYFVENKDKIAKYKKEYYKTNRERIREECRLNDENKYMWMWLYYK